MSFSHRTEARHQNGGIFLFESSRATPSFLPPPSPVLAIPLSDTMGASKSRKVIKYTYAERVLGSFSAIQREHKKHAIHLASLRAQIQKTANARKDKLGPHWKNWVGKAVHRLEEDGILASSEPVGTVALTPSGKKAIAAARRTLALPNNDHLSADQEDLLWKQVTHGHQTPVPVKRVRHRDYPTDDEEDDNDDEPEYVPPKARKRARTSMASARGKTAAPTSKLTKAQLMEELAVLKRAREADMLRAASPLTELEDDESEEVARLKEIVKQQNEEMYALRRKFADQNFDDAAPGPSDVFLMSAPVRESNMNTVIRTQSGSFIDHLSKQPTPAPTERDSNDGNDDDNMFDVLVYDPISEFPSSSSSAFPNTLVTPEATPAKNKAVQFNKVSSLEHALQQRATEVQHLEHKLSALESQLADRDARISSLQTNIDSYQSEKEALAARHALDLERAAADLEGAKMDIAEKAARHDADLARATADLEGAKMDIAEKAAQHDVDLARANADLERAKTDIAEKAGECERLLRERASAKDEHERLKGEHERLKGEHERVKNEKNEHEREISRLRQELSDSARAHLAKLQAAEDRVTAREASIASQEMTIASKEASIAAQARTIASHEDSIASHETKLAQLRSELEAANATLEQQIALSTSELSAASERIAAAQRKNESLAAQNSSLAAHNSSVEAKNSSLAADLADARNAAEALKPQMAGLDEALTKRISAGRELQERLGKTSKEAEGLRLKVTLLEGTLRDKVGVLEKSLEAKKGEVEGLKRDLAARREEVREASVEKEKLQGALEVIGDQLAAADATKASLMAELAGTSAMVEETTRKLEETTSKMRDAEARNDALQMQVGARVQELEQALAKHTSEMADKEIALQDTVSTVRREADDLTRELISAQTRLGDVQGDVQRISDALAEETRRGKLLEAELVVAREAEEEVVELRAAKDADQATIEGLKEVFSRFKESFAQVDNELESAQSSPVPRRRASKVPPGRA
ncbi:hypothetical protein C8R44DRAFT_992960 [Mycena epipterygia]|nr:hypothetical protein C8R44DRAFT_992960 [Mycena epipterygia]